MLKGSEGCQRCNFNCNLYTRDVNSLNSKLGIQRAEIEILKSSTKTWKSSYESEQKKRVYLEDRIHYLEIQLFGIPSKVG